eukprot:TRINITY_DN10227_c0_g1_i1.p1 TRINITY_DN10227_c0_g1~~TRINITY_DN10227_c0_g1_i1.p1  ORF type:complete len:500 (+),score=178.24 TRINITY_DN10227_c0_g1_i1:114-1613(+)
MPRVSRVSRITAGRALARATCGRIDELRQAGRIANVHLATTQTLRPLLAQNRKLSLQREQSKPNGNTAGTPSFTVVPDLDIHSNFVLTEAARASSTARKSSLYDILEAKGAVMGQVNNGFSDMLRAMYFPRNGESREEATLREYWQCRDNVAVWDMSSFCKLRVEGPDAAEELERLCSLKVDRPVEEGKLVYCCLCTEDGGIAADVTVLREAQNSFYIVVGAELLRQTLSFLRANIRLDARVVVRDVSAAVGVLHVAGPNSRALLRRAAPLADLSNEAQPFGTARTIMLGGDPCLGGSGVRVRAGRISFMGDLGWELHCAMSDLPAVREHIMQAGRDMGVADVGYACIGMLRTERMFLHWGADWRKGVDLTGAEIPPEVGMPVKKAPFLGREMINARRQQMRKRLVTIIASDPAVRFTGMEELRRDGQRCGFIATGSYSPQLGRAVGIGWVEHDFSGAATWDWVLDADARYTVAREAGETGCTISRYAAFDPKGERMRA